MKNNELNIVKYKKEKNIFIQIMYLLSMKLKRWLMFGSPFVIILLMSTKRKPVNDKKPNM